MKVLVTGANGFIGKNLLVRLRERDIDVITFLRGDDITALEERIKLSDVIIHLAGVNRPDSIEEFKTGNTDLTQSICDILKINNLRTPVVYTSSIQATNDNPYGISKKNAENALVELSNLNGNCVYNYRLPNVFGKWCKPNYNSAVATFCYNIVNDLPVQINDANSIINLVYIDDVVNEFLSVIESSKNISGVCESEVCPVYQISVGQLKEQLIAFKESKVTSIIEPVGNGLLRALYSTFISYYTPSQFSYSLKKHEDPRGVFVEMLKTKSSGQFSFFSAYPGITRGGHYHHSKNEKFLVIKGEAKFAFRNIVTDEQYELFVSGNEPQVVQTVPGWSHDITNVGSNDMFVMLWANEIFDPENPDTINYKV
ncbi:UDP-2-acetamido-2,6-beta-L-arabino-hexul-4-ose reductase [Aliikangiella sp. IMCC44359]|uniref:UDP-2-acetamido-2,6-beta-L-arabino-hexul-4-ose reductase n=1 Tax=Aliikangiella sp. IMCC44359 TaxID=3459125 RepID=UPI00403ADC14